MAVRSNFANGAVEAHMVSVHEMFDRRSWTLRNLERMNLLLELVRVAINNVDAESVYAGLIRRHLLGNGGRPATTWRDVRDARRTDKRVSTSSLRAWVA